MLKAIDELQYRPDLSARSLRSAKAYAIGLVYDNPNAHYIIGLQSGVLSVCRELGFGLQIHPCDSSSPGLTARTHGAGAALASRRPGTGAAHVREQLPLLRTLSGSRLPLVRIISAAKDPDDGYPCVFVDDRDAAYDITEHLIQLGHTRIGFLWGGKEHRSSPERFKGYADALNDYGIAPDKKLIVPGRLFLRRRFPRRAQAVRAQGPAHRHLRLQRRDRRRRAGGGPHRGPERAL